MPPTQFDSLAAAAATGLATRLATFLSPRANTNGYLGISEPGAEIIATAVIMSILAIAWTGMRVWARRNRGVSPFMLEDVMTYMAVIFHLGFAINCVLLAVIGGAGHHVQEFNAEQASLFAKLTFVSQFWYALVVGMVKLSITWNMKRIFSIRSFRFAAYFVMATSVAWMLQTMLVPIFLCTPISFNWDPTVTGSCGNSQIAYTSVSILDIVTDLLVLILPLKPLAKLHIQRPYKLALLAVFGSVIITMVLTAVRIYIVYNVDFNDLPFAGASSTIISLVQTGITIMIASSPLLRPVFDRTIGTWLSLSLRSTGRGNRSGTTELAKSQRSKLAVTRRSSRCFEQIDDSEPELSWELRGMKDPRVFTETTVHALDESANGNNPSSGILVTESTVITR